MRSLSYGMRWRVFGWLCTGCVSTLVRCGNSFIVPAANVVLPVAFLRLPVRDPLLCLTATVTVRERPIPLTPARAVLAAMFKKAGGHLDLPQSARMASFDDAPDLDNSYHGLDEVNLLEGLSSGIHILAPCFWRTQHT